MLSQQKSFSLIFTRDARFIDKRQSVLDYFRTFPLQDNALCLETRMYVITCDIKKVLVN